MRAAAVGLLGLAAACRHTPATAHHGAPSASASGSANAFVRLPPAPPVAPLDSSKPIFHPYGEVTVEPDDLTVTVGKFIRPNFSYRLWAEELFDEDRRALRRDDPEPLDCVRELKVTPLAFIPPFLSVREETYESCAREAHPGGETRLLTLQLNDDRAKLRAPRPASLTDFFDAALISRALRADPLVVKALGSKAPVDLVELVQALAQTSPVLDGEHCYSFPDDLLSRFAFHERTKDTVTVRVGLPGAGPCRYALTELGLSLPLPPLLAAYTPDGGFLAQDAPEGTAVIRLHSA